MNRAGQEAIRGGKERKGKERTSEGFCSRNGARGFANSTRSRSIIVAKSAVIMLDILIRGNSEEKLDPSFCVFFSASLSSPSSSSSSSRVTPSIYAHSWLPRSRLYRDFDDPVTVCVVFSPMLKILDSSRRGYKWKFVFSLEGNPVSTISRSLDALLPSRCIRGSA